jgi:hypothetical protein
MQQGLLAEQKTKKVSFKTVDDLLCPDKTGTKKAGDLIIIDTIYDCLPKSERDACLVRLFHTLTEKLCNESHTADLCVNEPRKCIGTNITIKNPFSDEPRSITLGLKYEGKYKGINGKHQYCATITPEAITAPVKYSGRMTDAQRNKMLYKCYAHLKVNLQPQSR